ncbi:Thermostable monoacylglycerol lipase [Pseudovibrio axinellae]|uniref:Thermostable monoacylglycerol lipase n=1 Tax=Pseudovibrio axinellae TaxID=989403 RepID=A0A165ZNN9_9HYPH|nr:alpha/beta fold hydrolase [Pseudovibrio axinellae]KZL20097.1 Thermostable monoacylglycerol lipase [Pseudovibrio axinellae]SEQ25481.1 Esterase/lipase [Pseudovibrio axinellae]
MIKILFGFLIVLAVVVWGYGWATNQFTPITVSFSPSQITGDVERYLREKEAKFLDIKPGLEKQIIWNDPQTKEKTRYSVIYIHGFSASKEEIRPVPDNVASLLGANLYFTRLPGHGRTSAAMLEASYNDWVDDLAEAIEIGRRIGEEVIIICTSLGGTLTGWAAMDAPAQQKDVVAIVFVSPVFKIYASGSFMLTAPYADIIVPLAIGPYRNTDPNADMDKLYAWNICYPNEALLPLAQFIKLVSIAKPEAAKIPALFIYDPNDIVSDETVTASYFEKWGAQKDRLIIKQSGDPNNHVIAGDLYSPGNNIIVTNKIMTWLSTMGIQGLSEKL